MIPRPGFDVPRTASDPTGLKAFGPRLQWMKMPEAWEAKKTKNTGVSMPDAPYIYIILNYIP